ncbi:MAG: TIGR03619 family F420-dependent LLM class oxidoreductase [Deltaproteobacteria bacterium]|nr:TIGR03619 family F420-dependent LLM class oxidoreductase [Deltaproteobacteria bacterium]
MHIGMYATTHGLMYRDNTNAFLRSLPVSAMQPVRIAQLIEQQGFHSMWFPDHVCMPLQSASEHVANTSGQRAYESHHNMLDAAVMMGAVAVSTTRLKLGTSVLISPYRHPLNDARQFATIDHLSNGRLLFGVGAGWMQEEFAALGVPYEGRGPRTDECIEIYKRSWTDEVVNYQGKCYQFNNVSMDPKPVQRPYPPIIYGGVTAGGARRAIRHCDGFYPLFLDTYAQPSRYADLQDLIRREAEKLKRDLSRFSMIGVASARLTSANAPETQAKPRRVCTGTSAQVLEDLSQFAEAGYSLIILFFDCPSGTREELEAQILQCGQEVIPHAARMVPKGEWKREP